MADDFILAEGTAHRPRNVDWKRAAALLYGDWGTSKAYVIGLAFMAAGFASLQIILAVCAVTASGRGKLCGHLSPFPGGRRRLFRRSFARAIAGRGWRASPGSRPNCNSCVERLVRIDLCDLGNGTGRLA